MTSKISFNNWIIFKAALKRLKWLGILYGVILFLEMPLVLWMDLSRRKLVQGNLWLETANANFMIDMIFHPIAHITNIMVPIIFGLILFHYLQSDRESTFFHSLPIKRFALYGQNLLAGLTLTWVPLIINGVLLYGVLSAFGITAGQGNVQHIYESFMQTSYYSTPVFVPIGKIMGYWFFINLLMTGFFLTFTVFVGMLTGNVLLQGALTFIGLVLPPGLYLLIKYNLWRLLYGFPKDINDKTVEWLSPFITYMNNQNFRGAFELSAVFVWYLVVAVLLLGLSMYLYQKRHAEVAGETLAAQWIRWVFKYGVATCAALTGGVYFSQLNDQSQGTLYMGYVIGAILGYIIADMIAFKSFHFYKRWKGMLVFGLIFTLMVFVVKLDISGYSSFVPEQKDIKEVVLSNLNGPGLSKSDGLKEEENIKLVRTLHLQIIKQEKENKDDERVQREISSSTGPIDPRRIMMPVEISYVLNNGDKVSRSYNINQHKYRELMYPIFVSEEAKRSMFRPVFEMEDNKIDQINIVNHRMGKNIRVYKETEIKELMAAIRNDILDISYEAAVENKVPSVANIEFVPKANKDEKGGHPFYNLNYYADFTNIETFLTKYNYVEDLFVNAEDVEEVTILKVGSQETAQVTDKAKIKSLLNFAYLEDERTYFSRQQQPVNPNITEYYGKIEMKKGKTLYVWFENNPHLLQTIGHIISNG